MGIRSRQTDPNDPMQWIGQPSTPHHPYYHVTGPGRLRSLWKGLGMYGYGFVIVAALTVGALIAAGLSQTYGSGFWALLALLVAAIIGALAAATIARRRRLAREKLHHHHHKAH